MNRSKGRYRPLPLRLLFFALALTACAGWNEVVTPTALNPEATPTLTAEPLLADRLADPIVLTGADVPALRGEEPAALTAWRYEEEGRWVPLAVQVDERDQVDLGSLIGRDLAGAPSLLTYVDPPGRQDSDPHLDQDDEILFMARDAGFTRAPAGAAPPVGTGPAVLVTVTDPLGLMTTGYVYLFAGGSPYSGPAYVTYDFRPTGRQSTAGGQIVDEDSTVTTAHYRHGFSARWRLDSLHLLATAGDSGDLLDRYGIQLAPDDCGRSENSFSAGDGAFLVNRSGPVRAIRGYIGANSGPFTSRIHRFYDSRHEVITTVRVHAIPGIVDFFDYSTVALGATYHSNLVPAGVPIDGDPDAVPAGPLTWELFSSPLGSLITLHAAQSDIPNLARSSTYRDDDRPATAPCAGDGVYLAAAGPYYRPIPCTDPFRAAVDPAHCDRVYRLELGRTILVGAPSLPPRAAADFHTAAAAPLRVTVEDWP